MQQVRQILLESRCNRRKHFDIIGTDLYSFTEFRWNCNCCDFIPGDCFATSDKFRRETPLRFHILIPSLSDVKLVSDPFKTKGCENRKGQIPEIIHVAWAVVAGRTTITAFYLRLNQTAMWTLAQLRHAMLTLKSNAISSDIERTKMIHHFGNMTSLICCTISVKGEVILLG